MNAPRVPQAPEVPMPCPEPGCDGTLRRKGSRYGPFYGCDRYRVTGCSGKIGCHPDGRPLGVPAPAETRQLRIEAHDAFDRLWKEMGMTRKAAYRWLAHRMGMTEVHIGELDADGCRRVLSIMGSGPRASDSERASQ